MRDQWTVAAWGKSHYAIVGPDGEILARGVRREIAEQIVRDHHAAATPSAGAVLATAPGEREVTE